MVDLAPINAQVDATLATMADAVAQFQGDVKAVTEALSHHEATSGEVLALAARLKTGTDTLAAGAAAARAAIGVPTVVSAP